MVFLFWIIILSFFLLKINNDNVILILNEDKGGHINMMFENRYLHSNLMRDRIHSI